jgi:hypothetical protein
MVKNSVKNRTAVREVGPSRISNEDVLDAFKQAQESAVKAGVKGAENWSLYFGQSTRNGYQAWIAGRSGARRGRGLGSTKRQAQASLLAMTEAFKMIKAVEPSED